MTTLLPSYVQLYKLYKNKSISLTPFQMKSIAKSLLQNQNQSLSKWISSHPKDLITLGTIMYRYSHQGKSEAEKLFKLTLETGNHDALYQYAGFLTQGWVSSDGKPDLVSSQKILQRLANENHAESLCVMGLKMMNNQKNPNHKFQGLDHIRKAVDGGSSKAMSVYGSFLKKNGKFEEAYKLLKRASDQRQVEALFELGIMYQQGQHSNDATPNYKAAFECFNKAAQQGLAIAQHNLASMYFSGIESRDFVLKPNVDFALEYWKMASIQDLDLSCMNLATYYMTCKIKERDYDLAEKHLSQIVKLHSNSILFKEAQVKLKELDVLRRLEPK